MTSPNASNEGVEEQNTQANTNVYGKFIRSFVSDKMNNKEDRLSFAKKIQAAKSIWGDITSELERFRDSKTEFSGLEISEQNISVWSLKTEVWSYLAGIQSKNTTLRSILLQEFDITAQDYTKHISAAVEDIYSEAELIWLLDSDEQREVFMNQVFKKNTPKRRLVSHILEDFNISDRFDRLEPHLQREFLDTVQKIKTRQQLQEADIMSLFESNILTVQEKEHILETFMPSITVTQALELGVIDVSMAQKIKKQALESSLDTWFFKWINLESYVENISNDDLVFSTQGLFSSAKTQEQLFEKNFFFKKFQDDFNAMLKKIEEDLDSRSIQTAPEMQEILSGVNHIHGIEKFKPWSTIVIKQQQKNASGELETVTLFAEIVSLASAGTFILKERWVEVYDNRSSNPKTDRNRYSDFINFVTKGNIPESVEILSPEELGHKIQTWEIQDENLSGNFQDKQEISADIQETTKKIDARKAELRTWKIPKSEWDNDEELQNLYKMRDEKNNLIETLDGANLWVFRKKLDELDSDGSKHGLEEGVSFVTDEGKWDVYSIQNVDEKLQLVTLRGLENDETMSYAHFLSTFEQKKAKRISKINNFKDLFTQTDDTYKSWQGFEFADGKVKNKSSKLNISYDYLVPSSVSNTQELFKIHSIDDTMVTVSFGKVKSNNKEDKKWNKTTWEIFSVENTKYTISIGVLDHYIKKNKLGFRSLEEWKVAEEEMKWIPKPEEKFGFANWFFQWMSFAAVMKWSKTAIEQITNMLNEWDDEKANQFALKMFGPILWKDWKTDMMSRVEQTQKKNMEDFIQRLKDINSKPATLLIKSWLLDPRTPEYKKEAGMFYMFEKYGALCAKELYDYQWQYFWYQKMWGKIGDKVWKYTHENNNREPKQNTTEEQLVYNLMTEQVKEWWYNWIKRRSKLAKELKAKRWQGKEEEYATGQQDGWNERDVKDRLDGALSEMASGNYPNAFGWLETITDKWGTMKEMNMVPFVMMFSGMAYNFEKDVLDKVKNFPADSRMLMMLRMMSYKWDVDLVNDTIMEVCSRLEHRWYAGIESKAKAIFTKRYERSNERDKQNATKEFYEEYGEVLTNVLYMLNTGKKDDIHNKMIFFEKDDTPVFSQYYDKMQWYLNADGSYKAKPELMDDAFKWAGTSWLDMYRASMLFEMRTWWVLAYKDPANAMWKEEIVPEFQAIAKRKYTDDPVENEMMRKKLIESNLRKFLSKIMSMHNDSATLWYFNSPTWWFVELNKWGVYFEDILKSNCSLDEIKKWKDNGIVKRFVNQIYEHENSWTDFSKLAIPNGSWRYTFEEKWKEKEKPTTGVSDLIQWKAMDTLKESITPEGLKGFRNSSSNSTSRWVEEILEDA